MKVYRENKAFEKGGETWRFEGKICGHYFGSG